MKLALFLIASAAFASFLAVAQSPIPTPAPPPPSNVEITIVADGTSTTLELTQEAAEIWNNFLHAMQRTGGFGDRFLEQIKTTTAQLAIRPEFTSASIKSELVKREEAENEVKKRALTLAKSRKEAAKEASEIDKK